MCIRQEVMVISFGYKIWHIKSMISLRIATATYIGSHYIMFTIEVIIPVYSDGHYANGTRYGDKGVKAFAGGRHGSLGTAFLDTGIAEGLKTLVKGKRVLDVGCGVGDWCCLATQYGAKSVDGFNIQPEMVELAKQATSHLDMVHIQVGDVADMPYD